MTRRRRMRLAVALLVVIGALVTVLMQPLPLVRLVSRHSPCVFMYEGIAERAVALTIDDSPHAEVTPLLLDVLAEHNARATFFVIGDHVAGNESILTQLTSRGHELGNHLWREYPSVLLGPDEFARELEAVDGLIRPTRPRKWFRPGSGWYTGAMVEAARRQGYTCALGSIYPFDTTIRSEGMLARYILRRIFPGAIIVLHDGKPDRVRTARVLRTVLPALAKDGYRVVTLSELADIASRSTRAAP